MENLEPEQSVAPFAGQSAAPLAAIDSLQFQKAEISAKTCAACSSAISTEYFQLSGADICPTCAAQWQALQQSPSARGMSRAILYGFGAAVAGAILMAVISAVTGYQFALAAIAVGWMVGKALRKGTGGLGGRRIQWLAVALTYFGITASTLPEIITEISKMSKEKTEQTGSSSPASGGDSKSNEPITFGAFMGAVAVLVGLSLISPFLTLASGISGIINTLIVFFGLQQAWKLTAADPRVLTGPMETGISTT